MFAAPAEGTLKDFMEFAETGFADHEQSPPNQRTHATEYYAELINRDRRYGRFRHASSLPKPTRTSSNLTPRNLPLSPATPGQALVATRSIRVSAFPQERNAIYFAGYDANKAPVHDSAWIYRSTTAAA